MKQLVIIILLYSNFINGQTAEIYSEEFIKEKITEMNSDDSAMIKFSYTPEFRIILKELVNIGWIEKAIKISDYYFPLFEKKLDQYNLPRDLKYLPILESGLNPKAISSTGAKGLWQFMEGTGDMMGLKNNNYIDLYYCPVANTDSACRYLESLYIRYNDWKFVLSSYNYGLGNINKKIKQAGSREYKDIYKYLPKETRAYVPKFLVIKYLVKYKDIYFKGKNSFKYVFTNLRQEKIEEQTTIKKVSYKYGINEQFVKFANPQLLTSTIPRGAIVYLEK